MQAFNVWSNDDYKGQVDAENADDALDKAVAKFGDRPDFPVSVKCAASLKDLNLQAQGSVPTSLNDPDLGRKGEPVPIFEELARERFKKFSEDELRTPMYFARIGWLMHEAFVNAIAADNAAKAKEPK